MCSMGHMLHMRLMRRRIRGAMSASGAERFMAGAGTLLTVAEVADLMRVSTMTVYRLSRAATWPPCA